MRIDRSLCVREALDRAELWLDAGLHAEALRAVTDARKLDPDDPTARLIEARIQLRSANARHAMAALDAHDHLCPQRKHSPEVATLRAEALVAAGQLDMAAALLGELAERFPDDARFHRRLAGVYLCQGRGDDAAGALWQLLRVEPNNPRTRRLLAGLIAKDQPDESIRVLEASREINDERTRLQLARLCRQVGRLREAEEHLLALLADHEDDAGLLTEAGQVADELGTAEVAIERLRRAAHRRPANGQTQAALACALMHAGRFASAGRAWWRVARRPGRHGEAWAGVLVCALACGRDRLAGRIARVLETRGCAAERRRLLALHWRHAAVSLAATAPVARHDAPSPLALLLHESAGKLNHAAQRFPDRADAHYHHAICAEAQGHTIEAKAAAERALRINPGYAAAQRLSSRLLKQAA